MSYLPLPLEALPLEDGADEGDAVLPEVVPRLSVPVLLPSLLGDVFDVAPPLAVLPLLAAPPGAPLLAEPLGALPLAEPLAVPAEPLGEPLIAPLLLVPLDDPSPLSLPHPATVPSAAAMTTANIDFLVNIRESFQSSRDRVTTVRAANRFAEFCLSESHSGWLTPQRRVDEKNALDYAWRLSRMTKRRGATTPGRADSADCARR